MPADHDRRTRGDPRGCGEARAAVQAHVQPRLGLAEGSRVHLRARGQETQEVDELFVGLGHRRAWLERPVRVLQQDLVAAGDLDVLDCLVVDQRLQPAQSEQGVEDRLSQDVLLGQRPRIPTGGEILRGLALQQLEDDRAAQLLLAGPVEAAAVLPDRGAELVRGLGPESRDQCPVDPLLLVCRPASKHWRSTIG